MKKLWIGELFLAASLYQDEANQTIGAPAINSEVITNRRNTTRKVTAEGKAALEQIKLQFKETYGVDIQLSFSRHCGCSMCPCSPGFKMFIQTDHYSARSKESDRLRIWVRAEESGIRLDTRPTRWAESELNFAKSSSNE